jgi:predicted permease
VREPAFTAAAVLTLALGVGANVAVFAVVEAVLLRPLPYADGERLVILNHRDVRTGITKEFIAIGDYVDLVERQTAFEDIVGYGTFRTTVTAEGEPWELRGLYAAPGMFELMRLRPVVGRGLEAEDSRPDAAPVMVLGHDVWQDRFGGDPSVVGRSVRVGRGERTIVGVAPQGFRFPPDATTDAIVPMPVPVAAPASRKSEWIFAVARLNAQHTTESGTANLAEISHQMERDHPDQNQGSTYYVVTLRDALVGSTRTALLLLLAAVAVVLLIACANVANLQLARSLARRRELAVRMALGAGRRRLTAMLLSESLALAIVAALVGVLFAQWGARALVALVPDSVRVPGLAEVRLDGSVLMFALALTIATTLVFGIVSAVTLRLEHAADVLVTAGRATMGRLARRATSGLVVVEVALAVVLLMGAGLILRSFAALLGIDPGFRHENVLTLQIGIPAERYADVTARSVYYERTFEALGGLPGVEAAGAAVVVPLTGNNWTAPFERAEHPVPAGERAPDVGWQVASGGFFEALRIPLLKGRLFDGRDRPGGAPVVIISESIERTYFPGENPVGRQIRLGNGTAEIVGVVGDIRRAGLRDDPRADLYFPFEMNPTNNQITVFVRTAGDPVAVVPSVQSAMRAIEPAVVFRQTRTLSDIAAESVRETELVLWLLSAFALCALVLAAVGIYGVMSYLVRQRTREIGTRMAVGATKRDILVLVMRHGVVVALAGIGSGVGLGLLAARSLRSILYGVTAADPPTLVAATLVLALTTLAACWLPALRAATVDPARTLTQ